MEIAFVTAPNTALKWAVNPTSANHSIQPVIGKLPTIVNNAIPTVIGMQRINASAREETKLFFCALSAIGISHLFKKLSKLFIFSPFHYIKFIGIFFFFDTNRTYFLDLIIAYA